jgi:hypothetical protein
MGLLCRRAVSGRRLIGTVLLRGRVGVLELKSYRCWASLNTA